MESVWSLDLFYYCFIVIMGSCSPKYKDRGCITNAMEERDLIVALYYPNPKKQKPWKELEESIQKEIDEEFRPLTDKQLFERRFKKVTYYLVKVTPGGYIQENVLCLLNKKNPLNVTILFEKEQKISKYEILLTLENQKSHASVRKCVWEDKNNEVQVSDVAFGPDFWRLAIPNSQQINYPKSMKCLECHGIKKCKKDCSYWEEYGGYVEE